MPDNRDKTTNLKCKKGHALAFTEELPNPPYGTHNGGNYGCDVCGKGGCGNDGLFHCTEGCSYDVCLKCNVKDKAKEPEEAKNADDAKEASEKKEEPKEEEAKPIEHINGPLLKITFMSGDRDKKAYDEYFATMPWTSDGYDKECYRKMMDDFGLSGIPALVVLNKDKCTAASKTARGDVGEGPLCIKKWIELIK